MAKNLSNLSTNSKSLIQKFNFWTLFRKFRFKVIRHFISTTLKTILSILLVGIIGEVFQIDKQPKNGWADVLVPGNFKKFVNLENVSISKGTFIVISLLILLAFCLVFYWDNLWEEELRVRGGHYSKDLLLEKFRRLPFEEQKNRKDRLNNLVEKDAEEVGYSWEHLPNHIYHSTLEILLVLFVYWGNFQKMTTYQIFFSLFWLIFINVVVYFFTRVILNNEKKCKKELEKEWSVINKERSNISLIESMGLSSQYREKQKSVTQKNEQLILNYNRTKSLNRTIPNSFLRLMFPFLLITLSQDFEGKVMWAFWVIFGNFKDIFSCLWEYADYSTSNERVSDFLLLEEKNDNLDKNNLLINVPIVAIRMENIFFRYKGQEEWFLKNYSRTFTPEKINRLVGKNGAGKSTILYLLLGMIVPEKGQIIIEDGRGEQYDLNKEVNLKYWRESNIAYCAHETLIEEGSTGQKQLANINNIISTKQSSQIFLFDEADNALDIENQEKIQEKIKKLVNNKIVIYIKH